MASNETGWTTERPDENGIYWFKQSGMLPEVLLVHGGFVYDFGDREPTSIGFFDGRGKWLGPLYASDAEQLSELRRTATVALKWMDWWLDSELCECDSAVHVCGKTERRKEADEFRAALNPSQAKKER